MKSNFAFQIAKVVGTPADGFWSQVHTFSPEDLEKKEKRGELLAVLVITGLSQGVEAVAAGREVLGRLHEEYYGSLSGSAFEGLRLAVQKVAEENENLEIAAVSLVGGALYLAIKGWGKIFLKREAKAGMLLKGDGNLVTGSGLVAENDLLVIGSSHFFKVVGSGVLKASLESGSPEEAVETLAPIVLGRNDMAAAAAILALAKKEEELPIRPVMTEESSLVEETREEKKAPRFSFFRKRRPIFVRSEAKEKRKRLYFMISLVLLTFLGVSLLLGMKRRAVEQKRGKARELIKQAEEKLNQGKTLSGNDPKEGRVLGEEVQRLTGEALSLKKDDEEAAFLQKEAEKFLSSLGQEVNISQPGVFMDLNFINDGGSGILFSLVEKNLVILDQNKNKIYLLDVNNKSYKIIDSEGEKGRFPAGSGQKVFVFDDKGILAGQSTGKTLALKIGKDSAWKEITAFSSFAGHLYLLDKGASNIWRYLWGDEGFGSRKSWFISQAPDLSGGLSLAIDGSIWVLTKDQILKNTLGKEESFSLSKMPEGFQEPTKIYTSENEQNLYVLDKGRRKVYQIAKSGEFRAAYSWEGLKEATDLVAVESLKKLFILLGTKIYEIGLR